jgi:uncharacterized protein DUF5678
MKSHFGALNEHPPTLPAFDRNAQPPFQREPDERPREKGLEPGNLASAQPFPYLRQLHSLLEQGQIRAAQDLFEFAKDFVPQDSKIREALAPPRVTTSSKRSVDRSAEFRWLDSNSSRFRGKWVALLGDRLVASADSLKELLVQLRTTPADGKPLIHHVD